MSAILTNPTPSGPAYTNEPIFRLTVDQYHELIRSGKLTEDDPVELVEGILVFKRPKNAPHATSNGLVRREIERLLPTGWHFRSQEPVTLVDGEPEPDGAVARGRVEDYSARHPGPRDIAMIIEVADSSIERDRGIKLRSYARAAIARYWIVNLAGRTLEAYSDPDAAADPPRYRKSEVLPATAQAALMIADGRAGEVAVGAMLPGI